MMAAMLLTLTGALYGAGFHAPQVNPNNNGVGRVGSEGPMVTATFVVKRRLSSVSGAKLTITGEGLTTEATTNASGVATAPLSPGQYQVTAVKGSLKGSATVNLKLNVPNPKVTIRLASTP
jgi:hypothetical protein